MIEANPIFATSANSGEGGALRAIGWPELAARINAARDLRMLLRRDRAFMSASFADAAAGYFAGLEDGKPAVNPDGLSHRKPCDCMAGEADREAQTGDREK